MSEILARVARTVVVCISVRVTPSEAPRKARSAAVRRQREQLGGRVSDTETRSLKLPPPRL